MLEMLHILSNGGKIVPLFEKNCELFFFFNHGNALLEEYVMTVWFGFCHF